MEAIVDLVSAPEEPTEEMLKAVEPSWMTDEKQKKAWREEYRRVYKAMLAARPLMGE